MVSPRQLIEIVAEITGFKVAEVLNHDRNLASHEPPLRTVAGRGRGGATVTPKDAAALITAVVASNLVKNSVATVQAYSALRAEDPRPSGIQTYDALGDGHPFLEGLAALIAAAGSGHLISAPDLDISIEYRRPNISAVIKWKIGDRASYTNYSAPSTFPVASGPLYTGDYVSSHRISERTVLFVGSQILQSPGQLE